MSKKAATPAFQAVPYQNVPLNDDTWRAFIYVLLADCDEHIPSILTPLFSHIGTGYRQRFSVLSKQDLITWALENVKTYDLCKEAKGFVDSSQTDPDIPDHLMGRLLKLKLWALKQEGIDARNVAKQAKQAEQAPNTTEVIEAPKNGKPGKKEEKDKEKAKQTPQKKATKGGSKAAEVPSRPESAQAAVEISKRKIKLRERKKQGRR
ncbi:hypothetical protein BC829DRAFT_549 [Chytridium lagenaria]|nr:hypothetical protein BC829DRAFT_549 [Chytridium lagenaria]